MRNPKTLKKATNDLSHIEDYGRENNFHIVFFPTNQVVETWDRCRASSSEICGGHCKTGTVFLRVIRFPFVCIIPPTCKAHLQLHATLIRGTKGGSLETTIALLFPILEHWEKACFHFSGLKGFKKGMLLDRLISYIER
jgi:hypothetical protein